MLSYSLSSVTCTVFKEASHSIGLVTRTYNEMVAKCLIMSLMSYIISAEKIVITQGHTFLDLTPTSHVLWPVNLQWVLLQLHSNLAHKAEFFQQGLINFNDAELFPLVGATFFSSLNKEALKLHSKVAERKSFFLHAVLTTFFDPAHWTAWSKNSGRWNDRQSTDYMYIRAVCSC